MGNKLFLKDFIRNRLDDDHDGDPGSGLGDLCLFHNQAARSHANKANRRKRPIISQEVAANTKSQHNERQGSKAGGKPMSASSGGGMAADVQRLCRMLKKPTASADSTRRVVEAQFREAMRRNEFAGATEDTVMTFASLILFLLDKYGTLEFAMESMDPKRKKTFKKDQFERGIESLGFREAPGNFGRIFAVLDQDRDGEICYEDVTCYQPASSFLGANNTTSRVSASRVTVGTAEASACMRNVLADCRAKTQAEHNDEEFFSHASASGLR